jgi:cardiolipin synthase (CMP-forming)
VEDGGTDRAPASLDRVATLPNLLSLVRILLIPVFVGLILGDGTEVAGLALLAAVVATDWVDGYIARHTGQVSNLRKILDPVADRLALTAALVALVVKDAFPLWAALLVIARDGLILAAGVVLLLRYRIRLDVRWVGKAATFGLMCAIPSVAWGNFELVLHGFALWFGWLVFVPSIVLYYLAAGAYAADVVRALRAARHGPVSPQDAT